MCCKINITLFFEKKKKKNTMRVITIGKPHALQP